MSTSKCATCDKIFTAPQGLSDHIRDKHNGGATDMRFQPDWEGKCEVCGESPTVPETGLCGPCTFGEAETLFGNW